MYSEEHKKFMSLALQQAKVAWDQYDEVPVGALIVLDGEIVASTHNLKETDKKATQHAEIIALNIASEKLGRWRLDDCEMYVTLEPCPMCAGALVHSRLKHLYFGAYDPKAGACGSVLNLIEVPQLNHQIPSLGGVLEDQCSILLKNFFQHKRHS